jgi:hypothetical protein
MTPEIEEIFFFGLPIIGLVMGGIFETMQNYKIFRK